MEQKSLVAKGPFLPEVDNVHIKYSPVVIWFQAIWLVRWSLVISSYSSDWLYMENARKTKILWGKIKMAESENSWFASVAEVNK